MKSSDDEVYAKFYFLDGKPQVVWKKIKRSLLVGDGWDIMEVDIYERVIAYIENKQKSKVVR